MASVFVCVCVWKVHLGPVPLFYSELDPRKHPNLLYICICVLREAIVLARPRIAFNVSTVFLLCNFGRRVYYEFVQLFAVWFLVVSIRIHCVNNDNRRNQMQRATHHNRRLNALQLRARVHVIRMCNFHASIRGVALKTRAQRHK